ncbi:MAG: hypothetical protein WBG08_11430 [Litorimonas sp.]
MGGFSSNDETEGSSVSGVNDNVVSLFAIDDFCDDGPDPELMWHDFHQWTLQYAKTISDICLLGGVLAIEIAQEVWDNIAHIVPEKFWTDDKIRIDILEVKPAPPKVQRF